jgi:hypothetical protein
VNRKYHGYLVLLLEKSQGGHSRSQEASLKRREHCFTVDYHCFVPSFIFPAPEKPEPKRPPRLLTVK